MIKIINFSAGMISGALVGMALASLIDPVSQKYKKCIRKSSNKICKAIEHTMDNFVDMF